MLLYSRKKHNHSQDCVLFDKIKKKEYVKDSERSEEMTNKEARKVKWGIIGLGDIARDFAETLPTHNAELLAVGSRHLQKAKDFALEFSSSKAYGNYHLLIRDPEVDAVYIATPNHRHGKDIIECLKNGKHVFCEKSITLTNAELNEAQKLAKKNNLVLAEAMTIYHMPLYQNIHKYIQENDLGEMRLVQASFGAYQEHNSDNRFFSKALGGGALYDIGVYALAFVRQFLPANDVEITSMVNLYETGVDEEALIQLRNKAGQMANVSLSFRAKIPQIGMVVFENAYISISGYSRADKAIVTYSDGREVTITAGQRAKAFQYEIENFSNMVLGGEDISLLSHTIDVTDWMDQLSKQWGMTFPKE